MNSTSKMSLCPLCGDSLMYKLEEPGSSKYVEVRCLTNYLGDECSYKEDL